MKAIAIPALVPVLTLILSSTASTPVSAQSMNVPLIVETVMGEVCVPFARDGDLGRAARSARMQGYALEESDPAPDEYPSSGRVELSSRHAGTVTLGREGGRGLCAVGIHEGTPAAMGEAAAPYLRALGLEPVAGEGEAVVWQGAGARLEIAPSARFRPGSELVLRFEVPTR